MISAVIITRDAERHLAAVLAALSGCAETLVLDSGSTETPAVEVETTPADEAPTTP